MLESAQFVIYIATLNLKLYVHISTVICPTLSNPDHGTVVVQLDTATAHYTCDIGFVLVGSRFRECNSITGEWSGTLPYCTSMYVTM